MGLITAHGVAYCSIVRLQFGLCCGTAADVRQGGRQSAYAARVHLQLWSEAADGFVRCCMGSFC